MCVSGRTPFQISLKLAQSNVGISFNIDSFIIIIASSLSNLERTRSWFLLTAGNLASPANLLRQHVCGQSLASFLRDFTNYHILIDPSLRMTLP